MFAISVAVVGVVLAIFYISSFRSRKHLPPPKILQDKKWGTHNYVTLQESGIKMHYVESGDSSKPLILFLHGFPEFWYSWRHQLAYFSQNYWCVAPDLRGYGDTDKPKGVKHYNLNLLVNDVRDLLNALGKPSCILVAHDWGGAIGYSFCYKYPDRVETYIALNTIHSEAWVQQLWKSTKQLIASWYIFVFQIPYLPEMRLAVFCRHVFASLFGTFSSPEDLEAYRYTFQDMETWNCGINYYRALIRASIMRKLKSLFFAYDESDDKERKIIVPVLCLFGNRDKYLLQDTILAGKDFCRDFKAVPMDGVHHFSNGEAPDLVNKYITAHLQRMGL